MNALFPLDPSPADDAAHVDWTVDDIVCWTRMQAEAGQGLQRIVARKEAERAAGNGLFFWGVGNAPARATSTLVRLERPVDVLFSVMKSRPKAMDVAPSTVFVWRRYIDHDGIERPLPDSALVTSRGTTDGGTKRAHYALMCHSAQPLELADYGAFDPGAYRNVGGRGAPIGASQVTALLRRDGEPAAPAEYRINMKAVLCGSYWVKLTDPVVLSGAKARRLDDMLTLAAISPSSWLNIVADVRDGEPAPAAMADRLPQLF